MKTRIIHTKFWKDDYIATLDAHGKLLFNYFLTNENNNLIGIYELPEIYISVETGLPVSKIKLLKQKFQQDGKFVFFKSWIRIINSDKYNSYNGEKLQKAKERELELVPRELIEYAKGMDTSMDTSMDTLNNHKSKTINHKSKIIKGEVLKKEEMALKEIVEFYNLTFGTNITSTKGFEENFMYWLQIHDIEKIKAAIQSAWDNEYWHDKMTLQILFRKKNQRGENVDYIEVLSNKVSTKKKGNIAFL